MKPSNILVVQKIEGGEGSASSRLDSFTADLFLNDAKVQGLTQVSLVDESGRSLEVAEAITVLREHLKERADEVLKAITVTKRQTLHKFDIKPDEEL
ncbi:hypothetical protein COV82_02150 [Candidatus Peregrinibacteria bacterium CG11_big_fil_rev_8_21_14_0_20_46_8]|nr:MAG: hypothetical protein COV82_02150 [Candidatus Peregrinibacteria bacterium CG11_big_fil_rev_8_21_14_0_20_46_8]